SKVLSILKPGKYQFVTLSGRDGGDSCRQRRSSGRKNCVQKSIVVVDEIIDPVVGKDVSPVANHRVEAVERVLKICGAPDRRLQTARANLGGLDRKSTRLNSSHLVISYAVFCL